MARAETSPPASHCDLQRDDDKEWNFYILACIEVQLFLQKHWRQRPPLVYIAKKELVDTKYGKSMVVSHGLAKLQNGTKIIGYVTYIDVLLDLALVKLELEPEKS